MKKLIGALAATGMALGLSGTAFAGGSYGKDIVDTADKAGDFGTLIQAVEAAGLTDTLKGEGPFTVFAPTDEAFAALPDGTVEELLMPENQERLTELLTYHVLPADIMSGDIGESTTATTVQGTELTATMAGDGLMIGDATVTQPDIEASNGVIHVIDTVLTPPGWAAGS